MNMLKKILSMLRGDKKVYKPLLEDFIKSDGKIQSQEKICFCNQGLLFLDAHMSDKEFEEFEKKPCAVCGKKPSEAAQKH